MFLNRYYFLLKMSDLHINDGGCKVNKKDLLK